MLFYIMIEAIHNFPMGSKPDFDHMMSSSIFLLYCLLTFSLYSISQHTSHGYSLDFTPARKLSMSSPGHDHKYHETQVCLSPINHVKRIKGEKISSKMQLTIKKVCSASLFHLLSAFIHLGFAAHN